MPLVGNSPKSTRLAGLYSDNVELTTTSRPPETQLQHPEEDLYPDSNASILRRHRQIDGSDDQEPDASSPSPFNIIRSTMTRSSLLKAARNTFGTLLDGTDGPSEVQQERSFSGGSLRSREGRRSSGNKSDNVGPRKSTDTSSTQASLAPGVEISVGYGTLPEAFTSIQEHGQEEEAILDFGDVDNSYDAQDPPDNSMLVKSLIVMHNLLLRRWKALFSRACYAVK